MYADMSIDIDGCDANGNHVSTWSDSQWDAHYEQCNNNPAKGYSPPSYQFEFPNEESLVTSKVFQKHLGMALAHKDREIASLRAEILRLAGGL